MARKSLDDHGLYDVQIAHISGSLTDNFNPKTMTVSLSDTVYSSSSVAAIGVAAHECGHAVQHAEQYLPIKIRSALVPVTNFGSSIGFIVLAAGIFFTDSNHLIFWGGRVCTLSGFSVCARSLLFGTTLPRC